jgi:hypothetical protein
MEIAVKRVLSAAMFSLALLGSLAAVAQQSPAATQQQAPASMAVNEWTDNFPGKTLDTTKWQPFSFEGASGGKIEVRDGELYMRGMGGSRFGVRSVREFSSDRFIVEAKLPRRPIANGIPMANAVLTVLFDSAGRNRLEWVWRNDGHFEAWRVKDGVGEELDNHRLATTEQSPMIAIARRGDTVMFLLNGEVGVQVKAANLQRDFHVMLYGYSSSENSWNSVRVVTAK